MTIKNSKENEELRRRNKDSFKSDALYWNKLSNERIFEITKQLLGIALIVLPLTGTFLLVTKPIPPFSLHLLVLSWIVLTISIISGFVNLWIEAKYFNYLSNDSSNREKIWSDSNRLVEEMDKETNKLGATKPSSSFKPLIIQGVALLIGVFLIMGVVFNVLSENSPPTPDHHIFHRHNRYF